MDPEFWLQRWREGQIGFHQDEINPYLRRHWHRLEPAPGERVLVPLAGKSRDMLWLRNQGHAVLGVELSPLAVEQFFQESGVECRCQERGPFTCHSGAGVDLWCGDFFALTPQDTQGFRLAYDRAALVALPPDLRRRYAEHMKALLSHPQARILLVTMDYPQSEMDGPPFSVSESEVRACYEPDFRVTPLERYDALAENALFRERGLTRLEERVYLLSRP